jgi:hypothetical protein
VAVVGRGARGRKGTPRGYSRRQFIRHQYGERRLGRYIRRDLLVLDELGYVPCDGRSADLLYSIISRRHEHAATVITTNLAFKQWGTVFPGAACVAALVDRFAQHLHTMDIDADSWRRGLEPISRTRREYGRGSVNVGSRNRLRDRFSYPRIGPPSGPQIRPRTRPPIGRISGPFPGRNAGRL